MDKAFSKAWTISLAETESFTSLAKFYITASSPRPTVKTSAINVEGMDGEIDTTEINGGIHYNNRTVKVWLVTKPTATAADVDSFCNTYVGKVIWLRNTTDGYQYKGRLALLADSGVGTPRMLTMEMNAEPFKYGTSDTTYNKFAVTVAKTPIDFSTLTRQEGTLNVYGHGYEDEYRIIFRGAVGSYAKYAVNVVQGAEYAADIFSSGNTVTIENTSGQVYPPDGFTPTQSTVIIRIKQNTIQNSSAKVTLVKTPYETIQNDGLDTLGYYKNGNPSGDVSLLLNGKEIPLDYTGGNFATSPELVIKSGVNKYVFVKNGDAVAGVQLTLKWRVANV